MKPGAAFFNFPQPLERSIYADAVACYVAAVRDRAVAVYQVGNVSYPGLSDIDLIVAINKAAWDNNQYFSPFVRLPKHFRALFHHEPRFMPTSCVDEIAYSSCGHAAPGHAAPGEGRSVASFFGSRRRLVAGVDVLGSRSVDVTNESWQRCRVLEITDRARTLLESTLRAPAIDVVKMMSRATTLRYPMRHLNDLLGMSRDVEYENRIDAARKALLRPGARHVEKKKAAEGALHDWQSAAQRFEANVRTLFEIGRTEDFIAVASAMISGKRRAPGIDPDYLTDRLASIRRYHDALFNHRLSAGSIFATKPYNGSIRHYVQPAAQRIAAHARWRWSPFLRKKQAQTPNAFLWEVN